ncbi:uncharacterized protein LOC126888663 [Diabrotica virgifera virgifera]|uniref:DUF5641 domain-containing protein n=1 Tax=Diabrotica virgifera virgifera TaxID=50390 RepID=A0ABM5KS13_DIAVI|nr:uncharacterized protein LOC126888663 [Diabrotica virgifera virgifera]
MQRCFPQLWERLVRVVKELLRRQLGKASLHYVELYTVLCDIESVINQRPLTYVSEVDEFEVLTPSSFLKPLQGNSDEVVDLDIVDSEFFKGRFRHIKNLRQMLRDRFRKEYLAELVNYGQRRGDSVKVGDVVMVGSDNVKRINWPMGKIIEVYSGQDGIQRVAKVKTKNGVLVRPCLRLYRVELPINDIQENLRKDKEESTEQDKSEKGKKSRYGRTLKTPHKFTAA